MEFSPEPSSTAARPVLHAMRTVPWIRSLELGGRPLHELVDEQVQIAFAGDGPLSQREFVPQTTAAARLLDGAEGAAFERVVRGMLSRLDGQEATGPVEGIALAANAAGYAANWSMAELEWEGREVGNRILEISAETTDEDRATITEALNINERDHAKLDDLPAGMLDIAVGHRWLTFGPGASRELLAAANGVSDARRASRLVGLVRHELEHRRTSLADRAQWKPEAHDKSLIERKRLGWDVFGLIDDVNWIEEATANVLSRWPGELETTLRAAGIKEPFVPHPPIAYEAATTALERLLELAGADHATDPTGRAADVLLQQTPLPQAPAALARAIAGEHDLGEDAERQLRDRIHHLTSKSEIFDPRADELIAKRLRGIEQLVAGVRE